MAKAKGEDDLKIKYFNGIPEIIKIDKSEQESQKNL